MVAMGGHAALTYFFMDAQDIQDKWGYFIGEERYMAIAAGISHTRTVQPMRLFPGQAQAFPWTGSGFSLDRLRLFLRRVQDERVLAATDRWIPALAGMTDDGQV